jgi:hypothetical protein
MSRKKNSGQTTSGISEEAAYHRKSIVSRKIYHTGVSEHFKSGTMITFTSSGDVDNYCFTLESDLSNNGMVFKRGTLICFNKNDTIESGALAEDYNLQYYRSSDKSIKIPAGSQILNSGDSFLLSKKITINYDTWLPSPIDSEEDHFNIQLCFKEGSQLNIDCRGLSGILAEDVAFKKEYNIW